MGPDELGEHSAASTNAGTTTGDSGATATAGEVTGDPGSSGASSSNATSTSTSDASTSAGSTSSGSGSEGTSSGGSDSTSEATTSDTSTSGGDVDPDCPAPVVDGLIACYAFPEDELDLLLDASGNGLDGSMEQVSLVPSLPGQGVAALLGAQSVIRVQDAPLLNPTQITLGLFVRTEALSGTMTLIDKEEQYGLSIANNMAYCWVRVGDEFAGGGAKLPHSEWHHIACGYNGTSTMIRVYGPQPAMSDSISNVNGPINAGVGGDLAIGFDPLDGVEHFLGAIDRVVLYDRRLTDAEMCALAGPLC